MDLIKYDAACRAIADCVNTDEIKNILNHAEAIRAASRMAKNRELEVQAAEIRFRAERRLGELIAEQRRTVGLAKGGQPYQDNPTGSHSEPVAPTLAEAGIDKKLSMRSQKLAAVPAETFEEMIGGWRGRVSRETERVTVNLLREGCRHLKRDESKQSETCTVEQLETLIGKGRKFRTIYADPPWLYGNQATRAATGNHYEGLSIAELCALPVEELAEDNCQLHLWTTNGFLFDAERIIDAWGFQYKSCFVWVKPQMGIGNYWRVSHEFLLFAVRGNAPFQDKGLKSWAELSRSKHSAKPEAVAKMVERAGEGERLELFGRRPRTGWVVWGDQIKRSMFDYDVEEI